MGASAEESGPEKHLQRHELAIVNFINPPTNCDRCLRDIPRILQTWRKCDAGFSMATSYFEIFEVFLTFLGVFVEVYLETQFRDMLTLENVVSAKTYKTMLTQRD